MTSIRDILEIDPKDLVTASGIGGAWLANGHTRLIGASPEGLIQAHSGVGGPEILFTLDLRFTRQSHFVFTFRVTTDGGGGAPNHNITARMRRETDDTEIASDSIFAFPLAAATDTLMHLTVIMPAAPEEQVYVELEVDKTGAAGAAMSIQDLSIYETIADEGLAEFETAFQDPLNIINFRGPDPDSSAGHRDQATSITNPPDDYNFNDMVRDTPSSYLIFAGKRGVNYYRGATSPAAGLVVSMEMDPFLSLNLAVSFMFNENGASILRTQVTIENEDASLIDTFLGPTITSATPTVGGLTFNLLTLPNNGDTFAEKGRVTFHCWSDAATTAQLIGLRIMGGTSIFAVDYLSPGAF